MQNKLFKHLKTIHIHRKYVRQMCFKMGIPWRGLVHDLSKYSIAELKICKYYTGKGSPHQVCREEIGYSPSRIFHYHKNRHHFQYWWDESEDGKIIPIKMPYKYLIESFCDMVGASKAYAIGKGKEYSSKDPWDYYQNMCKDKRIMNKESENLLVHLLWYLNILGEKEFLNFYKRNKKDIKNQYETGAFKNVV